MSKNTNPLPTAETDTPQKPEPLRLDYLDGLRGLSSLYVVLNHAGNLAFLLLGDTSGEKSHLLKLLLFLHFHVFGYGTDAVCIFIVLSGYCLMLPVVQSDTGFIRGGVLKFVLRRARRILPPYYAALALCLLFFAVAPMLHINTTAMVWNSVEEPVFQSGSLISHVLVMHCWTPWIRTIDPPMWSVSVEWNIYFVFAFLLLPLFRRIGIGLTVLVAFVLGLAPHFLVPNLSDHAHPWMLGLFALGMFGATVNFAPRPNDTNLHRKPIWETLTWSCAVLFILLTAIERSSVANSGFMSSLRPDSYGGQWPLEIVVGAWGTFLIISCTRSIRVKTYPLIVVKVLEKRAFVKLGVFSYSMYLIHSPILELSGLWLKLHTSPLTGALLMYIVAVPLALIFVYGFHLLVERPFLPIHFKRVLEEQKQGSSQTD